MRRRFLMGCPEPVEDGYEYIAKDCPINDVYGVRSDINFHTGDILEFDIDVDETFSNNDIFRVSENGKGYPAKSFFITFVNGSSDLGILIFYPNDLSGIRYGTGSMRMRAIVSSSGMVSDPAISADKCNYDLVRLLTNIHNLSLVIEPQPEARNHVYIHYIRIKRGV